MSKTYRIPISWEMYGHYYIEADNLQEAIDRSDEMKLPMNGSYINHDIDFEALLEKYPDETISL